MELWLARLVFQEHFAEIPKGLERWYGELGKGEGRIGRVAVEDLALLKLQAHNTVDPLFAIGECILQFVLESFLCLFPLIGELNKEEGLKAFY